MLLTRSKFPRIQPGYINWSFFILFPKPFAVQNNCIERSPGPPHLLRRLWRRAKRWPTDRRSLLELYQFQGLEHNLPIFLGINVDVLKSKFDKGAGIWGALFCIFEEKDQFQVSFRGLSWRGLFCQASPLNVPATSQQPVFLGIYLTEITKYFQFLCSPCTPRID